MENLKSDIMQYLLFCFGLLVFCDSKTCYIVNWYLI